MGDSRTEGPGRRARRRRRKGSRARRAGPGLLPRRIAPRARDGRAVRIPPWARPRGRPDRDLRGCGRRRRRDGGAHRLPRSRRRSGRCRHAAEGDGETRRDAPSRGGGGLAPTGDGGATAARLRAAAAAVAASAARATKAARRSLANGRRRAAEVAEELPRLLPPAPAAPKSVTGLRGDWRLRQAQALNAAAPPRGARDAGATPRSPTGGRSRSIARPPTASARGFPSRPSRSQRRGSTRRRPWGRAQAAAALLHEVWGLDRRGTGPDESRSAPPPRRP